MQIKLIMGLLLAAMFVGPVAAKITNNNEWFILSVLCLFAAAGVFLAEYSAPSVKGNRWMLRMGAKIYQAKKEGQN